MLAVVLSLFTAFPVFQEFRVALEDFLTTSLMPPSVSDNIMDYLNQFAHQASRLTAIGGAFLLVTSLLLIMTIDQAFNDIWRVSRPRPPPPRAEPRARCRTPLGARDGIAARNLLGAILNEGGLAREAIGRIQVRDSFSLVELPEDGLERLLGKLKDTRVGGKQLKLRRYRED